MKNEYLLTKEGLDKLKEELLYREGPKKDEIKQILEEMRAQGDLRENDGYTLAVEDYKSNEQEIAKIKDMISNAKIVKAVKKDVVEIGDSVTVEDETGKETTFKIGGVGESNPIHNIISSDSPLGHALIGKKLGNKVEITTPRGKIQYTVKKI